MSVAPASSIFQRGKRLLRAALVAVVAMGGAGCVRAPRPTGYLGNYNGLVRQPLTYFGIYAQPMPAAKKPRLDHVLQILPSRWDAPRLPESALEKELLDLLDDRLQVFLQRYAPPSVIVTRRRDIEDLEGTGANVTQLRCSITYWDKGVGILRPLFGAFYLGPTQLQVEGTVVDWRTREALLRFARRGLGTGVVIGLMTPQSVSAKFCWRLSINETADLLAQYVVSQLRPPPQNWWRSAAR